MKITNLTTGNNVRCNISEATKEDIESCREDFSFDWIEEFRYYKVHKLCTEETQNTIQALISTKVDIDFLYVSKIERANFRKAKLSMVFSKFFLHSVARDHSNLG